MTQQPQWQPPSMIPMFVEMAEGMLDSAKDQLSNMQRAQHKPHVLDDATLERVTKAYTEQKGYLPLYLEQCQRWQNEELAPQERQQVNTVHDCMTALAPIVDNILSIATDCEKGTINQILAKDDATLLQELLSGDIKPPRSV